MILTWENGSTYRETCPGVALSTKTHAWSVHEPNPDLRGERVPTDHLSKTNEVRRKGTKWCSKEAIKTRTRR